MMKRILSSRLVLAEELKPLELDFGGLEWKSDAGLPIIVRGPEDGLFTVVSGIARYLRDRRNVIVDALVAKEASLSDYGRREKAALVAGKPAAGLPADLTRLVGSLVVQASGIDEVWLFGSRTDGRFRHDSDWDLFFKGPKGLALFLHGAIARPDLVNVDLFVWETGAKNAVNPWEPGKQIKLNLAWHQLADDYAEYDGVKETEDGYDVRRCRALRVWP